MKRLFVLLAAAALMAGCQNSEITIISFNTGAFSKFNNDTMEASAKVLRAAGADAIGLNELDSCNRRHECFQAEEFARALGKYSFYYAGSFPFADGSYGNAIVCRDRIIRSGRILLPMSDGVEQRAAVYVETPRYVLATTHLDHVGIQARIAQAQALNDWFTEHYAGCDKPVLLCGDFNAIPVSPAIETLCRKWTLLSGTQPTYPSGGPVKCIDYIFALKDAAPVTVRSAQVLAGPATGLSDHQPVLVRLSTE